MPTSPSDEHVTAFLAAVARDASTPGVDWYRASVWGLCVLVAGYMMAEALHRRSISFRDVVAGIGTALVRTVQIAGGLAAIVIVLMAVEMFRGTPGRVAQLAQAAQHGIMLGVDVVAAMFLARQFIAPPWWRLNAWSPDPNVRGYQGAFGEIVGWIYRDCVSLVAELSSRDRLLVVAGGPALITMMVREFGINAVIAGSGLVLLVLYVALGVALMTANRIPRVLLERLQELRIVAHAIASGNLAARARPTDQVEYQELSELINDINTMAASLQMRDHEARTLQAQLGALLHKEQELSTRDSLTQLRNRRFFNEALGAELVRCERTGAVVTVAVIDLDNFKQVNDRYGHKEGDAVLQRMAYALSVTLRPYDLACRLGGEEFGIIFPETGVDEAKVILERIMDALATSGPQGRPQTFSGGVATYPRDARTMEDLIHLADEASYEAKLKGKARVVIYDPAVVQSMQSPERQRQKARADVLNTARQLVEAVDAKESRDHSERTARIAMVLGSALGCDEDSCQLLYMAGLLHDIGKIGLHDSVLSNTGLLSDAERLQMEKHPEIGAQIVANAGMPDIALWVRHHHERWDGTGYPDRLAGDAIPLAARILRAAESFESMTSDRTWRSALTVAQAMHEIQLAVGTEYDAHVISALVWAVENGALDELVQHSSGLYVPPAYPPGSGAPDGQGGDPGLGRVA